MAEPYTDEQLEQPIAFLQALEEQLSADNGMKLRDHLARIAATIERLQRERDEARNVARVLATHGYEACDEPSCRDARCVARRTARAYPEVPHG